jgi:hypothetical protein
MVLLTEIVGEMKTLLVGIPESIELLLFGVGLIAAVVLLRWFLNRDATEKADDKFSEKSAANN